MNDCKTAKPPIGAEIAVRGIDNWDGEGDPYLRLATVDEQGVLRDRESSKPLLDYVGDKIQE